MEMCIRDSHKGIQKLVKGQRDQKSSQFFVVKESWLYRPDNSCVFSFFHIDVYKRQHQENGGHGEAVNAGMRNATGLYFKVVDSDDWVNAEAYAQILKTLEELIRGSETVDLLISNFVYEKQGAKRKRVMQYRHCLPVNEVFGWNKVHMHKGKYLLMHSMIYRTKLLHDCGLELPKHTFYVDNIFAFEPLVHVKKMYYLDVNFYSCLLYTSG